MYNSPSYKKKSNEVQIARGRLKNALHDLVANSDEEVFPEEFSQKEKRGRPKRTKKDDGVDDLPSPNLSQPNQQQIHETFVMKLFDRSLDLSKYDYGTPLYPICRAWIDNVPRSTSIRSYRGQRSPSPELRENNGGELLEKVRNGEVSEIIAMPAPLDNDILRIPLSLVDDENDEGRKKAELSLKGASKSQLLAAHKQRWKKVREHWQSHTKTYQEQKYELNYQIIDAMYKC